jgi:DNA-binding transcriptional ArsR family regulator
MAKENFLLVSLKEAEAKKLAQVISNDTSRRILDHLATVRDDTEAAIAKKLGLAPSTVHYNMKALLQAKLVQVDEFHYSEKGKEVNHYSLANKYVIIAPDSAPQTLKDKLRRILPVALISAACAGLIQLWTMLSGRTAELARNAPEMLQAQAPMLAEKAADTSITASTAGREALPRVAEHAQSIFLTDPALFFLYGAVFAVIIFIIMDYLHSRKKS